jgi:hypothetical protein
MAGAGYKLFNTGDVLTAAQVNTYLQEQVVMVFASATARTTALSGVLSEGMVSYLQDTNAVEVYNGTSWVGVSGAGDLTEIVAGAGITVTSGTGPIPTVALTTPVAATNGGTAQSTYATGDLLYASGTNTLAKRGIGSTGDVLTVAGGVPTWSAPASGGGMTLISSQAMSGVSSISFNSISGSYTHLQLILRGYYASSGTPSLQWELNSDTTTTNYIGSADVQRSGTSSNQELWNTKNLVGSGMTYRTTSTSYNHLVIDLFDYTNTVAWKNCFIQGFQLTDFSTTNRAYIYGNLAWTDTSAVTSIKILNSASNNWSGGTALLYGVK